MCAQDTDWELKPPNLSKLLPILGLVCLFFSACKANTPIVDETALLERERQSQSPPAQPPGPPEQEQEQTQDPQQPKAEKKTSGKPEVETSVFGQAPKETETSAPVQPRLPKHQFPYINPGEVQPVVFPEYKREGTATLTRKESNLIAFDLGPHKGRSFDLDRKFRYAFDPKDPAGHEELVDAANDTPDRDAEFYAIPSSQKDGGHLILRGLWDPELPEIRTLRGYWVPHEEDRDAELFVLLQKQEIDTDFVQEPKEELSWEALNEYSEKWTAYLLNPDFSNFDPKKTAEVWFEDEDGELLLNMLRFGKRSDPWVCLECREHDGYLTKQVYEPPNSVRKEIVNVWRATRDDEPMMLGSVTRENGNVTWFVAFPLTPSA